MKRLSGLVAFVLLATPVFAQDVDFGAFSDAPALAPIAPAARGAAPARGAVPAPPPVDRLVRLRDVLLKGEAPLTKEQETALNALIAAEIPEMRKTIQTHGQQMMAARPPVAPPAGLPGAAPSGLPPGAFPGPGAAVAAPPTRGAAPAPAQPTPTTSPAPPAPTPNPAQAAALAQAQAAAAARGGVALPAGAPNPALLAAMAARGAGGPPPSSRVPAEVLDALEVEMRQMNDALFTKLATAPALDEKQKSVLTKMSRTQIKSRGGFDALRISMEDANAPFSEEQTPKVQVLFEDQKKARAELAKETQGTPDPAKLKVLERETLTKVVGMLTPAQRTALLGMLRAQQ